ncbi:TonB-dependent siderophore receptor [Chitinophaga filiformis]|uniref:TonB-dependent siderophore receptor n=1 Tax=Chitinophaga filiformis TaxID=104663 RepID=UPI001F39C204|nr:TonB-dependent siderophore receptor [Chitinophaga filiformis]MCF6407053.1 TonB-dependent siderophore receptor [Chitinophaga filiformis]
MNKMYCLLFFSFFVTLTVQAQHSGDSIKVRHLKQVNVETRKRTVKSDSISATLKLGGRLLETPQNITGIINRLLQLQGGFEMKDALRNASGVYLSTDNVFSGANTITMRGFNANISRNGLIGGNTYENSQEDESIIESVEVIKGPAGFINGYGEPGGAINVVTKTPGKAKILNVTATAGSFNFYRAAVDIGVAIREKGFSYRVNGAVETQDYFVDWFSKNKYVLSPVIQYNFSKRTYLLAEYNMILSRAKNGTQFTKGAYDSTILKDDRNSNYMGDPGLPVSRADEHTVRLQFVHALNDNWKLTSQSSFKRSPFDQWTFYKGGTFNAVSFNADGTTTRSSFNHRRRGLTGSSQLFLNGTFKTGQLITHRVLTGLDYTNSQDSIYQAVGSKLFPFDQYHLKYGENTDSLRLFNKLYTYNTSNEWLAAYAYDAVNIGKKVIVSFGGRFTYNEVSRRSYSAPLNKSYYYKSFTPRAGITWMIMNSMSLYALYDQSFQPQVGVNANGELYVPLRSANTEAGVKKEWFSGLLSTTVSGYIIRRNNVLSYDAAIGMSRQIGQVRSKGLELDVLGMPVDNLTVSANYALLSSIISEDANEANVGKRYARGPKQQINAWLMYGIKNGILKGLSFSLGETTVIGRGTAAGTDMPDYTKLDASIGYDRGKYFVRVLLDNITSERYMASGDRKAGNSSTGMWYYTEGAPFSGKVQVGIRLF